MELTFDDLEADRSRWICCDGVDFKIAYRRPEDSEKFRKRLVAQGVLRDGRGGVVDFVPGRFKDWCAAMAREYVLDWRGNIRLPDPKYDADKMASILFHRADVLKLVTEAVGDYAAFFSNGANGSTAS